VPTCQRATLRVVLPRFLVTDLDPASATASVTGGEAHHLSRVLRLGAGDEVIVFDGRGLERRATIERIAGSAVAVRLGEALTPAAERRVPLTLAQAVLKGTSMDEVVRDATMIGAARIVPLVTAHTVARKAAAPHGAERWRRVALASTKQCRRSRIPEVTEPLAFDAWIARPRDGVGLLLVEPSVTGVEPMLVRGLASRDHPSAATLLVGPEGGWAADEVQAALAGGCVPITLGPLTLRAEAVPLAALAALTVVWD
jgi:16S rRNA (uracil1498-N3)-methyltransferase